MVCARNSNVLRRITTLLIISCLLTVGLCVNTASALPGSGTQEDPWRIESLADFDEFAADPNYWDDFIRLETDVNLAGRTYTTAVIAPDVDNSNYNYEFDGTAFTGVFDGNDHKVTNLTIDDVGAGNWYLGLFGYIDGGEVRNLGIQGGFVSGRCYVGGLVGYNSGSVSNCYSTGDVNGVGSVGGLVGFNAYGAISNCYSTGDVSGDGTVGGLVGINDVEGNVSNCYSTGDVSGDWDVGGLVGSNGLVWPTVPSLPGHISISHSTGDVSGTEAVGGLVGLNTEGIVSNCYSIGDVNGVGDVGGLVGENCSYTEYIEYFGLESYIYNSYSIGDVNGVENVGGLVGRNGFIGDRKSSCGYIFNSYSTSDVQGASNVGGLVGYSEYGGIGSSFWDVQTSGEPNMCGGQGEDAAGCDPNCGKTTAEMKTRSTFTDAGWDFVDIWLINEGATYPVLRQEIRSDLNGTGGVDFADFAIFADHWLEGTGD